VTTPIAGAPEPTNAVPPEAAADAVTARPRWYAHSYNRAGLYRLAGSMNWLPRPARLGLARRLGRLAPWFLPAERAAIRATLARVTGASGERLEALTLGVFREFAMCFSDLLSTNRQPLDRLRAHIAAVRGTERMGELTRGVISLTAHVGNWELAGRLLAQRSARPTHVVVAEEEARALERWVRRDGDGVRFVPRSRPTVSLGLVAALRRGEVVALQGDRALGNRGDVMVPFFGALAPFPIGPFVLARASGAPIVPAFCLLDGDHRYAMTVCEPLTVPPGGEEKAVQAWVAILEDVVRQRPTQWFNFFDVWHPFANGARA